MNKKGFSLIELMVALIVGMIAMAATYSFLISSLNVFSAQEDVTQVQFNAQGTLRYLNDTFKNAGSGVVARVPLPAIDFLNKASTVDSASYLKGTDAIQIRSYGNSGDSMDIKSQDLSGNKIIIKGPNYYIDDNTDSTKNTSLDNLLVVWKLDPITKRVDDYAILKIGTNASPSVGGFALHSAGPYNNLEFNYSNPSTLTVLNKTADTTLDYSGGKAIMIDKNAFLSTTFFVDPNGVLRMADGYYNISNPADANNVAALPLLDNVEDFQLQFGFDTSGTELRDVNQWSFNPVGDGYPLSQCIAIKCYVLLKGNQEDRYLSGVKRIDIDPDDSISYANPKDNIRRRLYSFTVQLRNRLSI